MRKLFVILGFFFIAVGSIGVVLPVLPTTPFLLVAAACFAKGSRRFHDWFIGTRLYQNHLDEYVKTRSMTMRTKLSILIPASLMLTAAFIFTPVWIGRILILAAVIFKYYYFIFRIRTIPVR